MTRAQRPLRFLLIALTLFLALSAVPGGISLLVGINAPPVEPLKGSVFSDFLLPGLALLVLVGGSAVVAAVLLLRKSRFAVVLAITTGLIVMSFEFVEVIAIGSPPGPARSMQILYFGVGVALVAAALGLLLTDGAAVGATMTAGAPERS